jgi:hypothetical protein
MTDDIDPRATWQNQPTEENMFAMRYVQTGMKDFYRSAQWGNWTNYIAAIVGIGPICFLTYVSESTLVLIGLVILLATGTVAAFDIYRHGRPKPVPTGIALADAVNFLKSELGRRRAMLRRQWWYVPPVIPVILLFLASRGEPHGLAFWIYTTVGITAGTIGVFWIGLELRVRQLQRQIDALPRADEV